MPACFRGFVDHNRHAHRAFFSVAFALSHANAQPVHADFVVRIDHVLRAKLMSKHFSAILRDRDGEVFTTLGPVSVTNPQTMFAAAWNLEILIDHGTRLIRACGR